MLPESCIAHVLSLTSPRDACTAASVSTAFRRAADSDTVWDRFLPFDHRHILLRAVAPLSFSSKKELYRLLADSLLIDAGNLSLWLERMSGKKCIAISARGLSIAWGDTPRYWGWAHSAHNSRFSEVAELLTVCWLEIKGSISARVLSPRTTYRAYLVFKLAYGSYGLTFPSQEALIKIGTDVLQHSVCLQPDVSDPPQPQLTILGRSAVYRVLPRALVGVHGPIRSPRGRDDGWMELEMGKFFIGEGEEGQVDIMFKEVEGGQWKRGLIIQCMEIRPEVKMNELI